MGEAAQQALGVAELKLVADAGYANGEQAQALEDRGVQVHVPVKRSVNNQGDGELFDRVCFTYDAQADVYTCPAKRLRRVLDEGALHDELTPDGQPPSLRAGA